MSDLDLLTGREVAEIWDCSESTAWRCARRHLQLHGQPPRPTRADVVALAQDPARRPQPRAAFEYQAPPEGIDLISLGTFRRMLNPERPVSYETAHRILDRAGIAVFRVSTGIRLVSRKAVEAFLLSVQEHPDAVALDRHARDRRRKAREAVLKITLPTCKSAPVRNTIAPPSTPSAPTSAARIKF